MEKSLFLLTFVGGMTAAVDMMYYSIDCLFVCARGLIPSIYIKKFVIDDRRGCNTTVKSKEFINCTTPTSDSRSFQNLR